MSSITTKLLPSQADQISAAPSFSALRFAMRFPFVARLRKLPRTKIKKDLRDIGVDWLWHLHHNPPFRGFVDGVNFGKIPQIPLAEDENFRVSDHEKKKLGGWGKIPAHTYIYKTTPLDIYKNLRVYRQNKSRS